MSTETREQMFKKTNKGHVSANMSVCVKSENEKQRESVNLDRFTRTQFLRIGSEPTAAMKAEAEPSPPTSMQRRTFPQN